MEDQSKKYETGHIQKLQDQRVKIQKKTFSKWINSHLNKVNLHVNDLFTDLADGKILIKLMEVLSGERLGKPNRGLLRVQKVENVNTALNFIRSKVILENIGAEDIVDGNQRLILGLIWTIILRFEIQGIREDISETESGATKSAKEALLLWVQRKTRGYRGVDVKDFSRSWRDGMGFNALIHAHCPDTINYDDLIVAEHQKNLNNAFSVAQNQLGISKLLDAEDVDVDRPDDKSIMTYVASMYHTFAKLKTETTGAKRVGKVLSNALDVAKMIEDYERLVKDLLAWIQRKIVQLKDRNFANSVAGIQAEMGNFKQYRTDEKPPKYKDRSDIDALLFNVIVKQQENGLKRYCPQEGLLLKDIETAWNQLEKAEHERELSLRSELLRQERLKREAEKFNRKADLREVWLNDMTKILSGLQFGTDSQEVEATLKKHEAISTEIMTRKERFDALSTIARNLVEQNYNDKDAIDTRNTAIQRKWAELKAMLEKKQASSDAFAQLLAIMRDMETIHSEMQLVSPSICSDETGKHLMAADDLLERHVLAEGQLNALEDRRQKINKQASKFLDGAHPPEGTEKESAAMGKRLDALNTEMDRLQKVSAERKQRLELNRQFHQLWFDLEEEEGWVVEKTRQMKSKDLGKDLMSVQRLLRKHDLAEAELQARSARVQGLQSVGESLIGQNHRSSPEIRKRLDNLLAAWSKLREAAAQRRKLLEDSLESQQYYADAVEAEQWMQERLPLVTSKDYGKDESGARALSNRHKALGVEIDAFGENDMQRLKELSILMTQSADKHNIQPEKIVQITRKRSESESSDTGSDISDTEEKVRLVTRQKAAPTAAMVEITVEEEVEETVMKEVMKEVEEPKEEQQVQVLHNYQARDSSGRDISVKQGEILTLLNSQISEWWMVRNAEKKHGYVPSNYVRKVSSKQVARRVKKPVQVPVKVKVMKPVVKRVPADSPEAIAAAAQGQTLTVGGAAKKSKLRRTPSARLQENLHFDKVNVESRQKHLEDQYNLICALTKARECNLDAMEHLHHFMRQCDLFEGWMTNKEAQFNQKEVLSQDVEGAKKRYEMLISDLAANSGRLAEIDRLAKELLETDNKLASQPLVAKRQKEVTERLPNPVVVQEVKKRKQQIVDRWDRLNKLKCEKEKTLAGASSIELFKKTAEEAQEWIQEKLDTLPDDDVGRDKTTNETLKRRHQNLLREMAPIEEKMSRMHYLGKGVKNTYPEEAKFVDTKMAETDDLWDKLKNAMKLREDRLNNAGNLHKFVGDAKDLDREIDDLMDRAVAKEMPRDAKEAQDMLKDHKDLEADARATKDKLAKLIALGEAVLAEFPDDAKTAKTVADLKAKMAALDKAMADREKALRDAQKAQQLYKEIDTIDSLLSQQERMLDVKEEPASVGDVERAMKAHQNLAAMLDKQKDRAKDVCKEADNLIKEKHPESEKIGKRRDGILSRLDSVESKADQRWAGLEAALEFAQLKESADEMSEWVREKLATAAEDNYRDLANLAGKQQKHQAFEAEVQANRKALEALHERGETMIKAQHPRSKDIKALLDGLDKEWAQLDGRTQDKAARLEQASAQDELNKALSEAADKIDKLEKALASDDVGQNLGSAKDLLQNHKRLEEELAAERERLKNLLAKGRQLAAAGHFDQDGILAALDDIDKRSEKLAPRLAARKKQLDDSLLWHQFAFDVDQELVWIDEHRPLAASVEYGRSRGEASKHQANHKKLVGEVTNHQPSINRALKSGADLCKAGHPAKTDIEDGCNNLKKEWTNLEGLVATRTARLDAAVTCQQLLKDIGEVSQWIKEKAALLNSMDTAKDLDSVEKMLAKVKALEMDLGTYKNIVADIAQRADTITTNPQAKELVPEAVEAVKRKRSDIEEKLADLEGLAAGRKVALETQRDYLKYVDESEDLEAWINDKLVTAASEEYGDDFEHLQVITNRWDDFKATVDSGNERYEKCDEEAMSLLAAGNPNSEDIVQQQQRVRADWGLLLEHVDAREHKLAAAGEIHRFNRDWADCMDRLEEKMTAIPGDVGRDMKALQGYVRRHEAFEVELVSMEQQVQELVTEANRLMEAYPGGNAQSIENQMNSTTATWDMLQNLTDQRRQQLTDAHHYFKFCEDVRALNDWSADVIREVEADHPVHDAHGASLLAVRQRELERELDDRKQLFSELVNHGETMIEAGHFASDEIQDKVDQMLDLKARVGDAIAKWGVHIAQLLDQQVFYRDVNQLNQITGQQVARLTSAGLGSDVEEVEKLIEKHEGVERVVLSYEEKLNHLKGSADEMIKRGHFDADNIRVAIDDCAHGRAKVGQACSDRRRSLDFQLRYLRFLRDASDAEGWLEEKKAQLEMSDGEAKDLEDKMRLLQRHQAVEAEVHANEPRFKTLEENATDLIKDGHPQKAEIRQRIDDLLKRWKGLLSQTDNRSRLLEEAKDLLSFYEEMETVESWIREKENLVAADDMGDDLDHCQALQQKLTEPVGGKQVDEARVTDICRLADKLAKEGVSEAGDVSGRKATVQAKWVDIQSKLGGYQNRLKAAEELHKFNRDADSLLDQIKDRIKLANSTDLGKDVPSVEKLVRKQDALERDIVALQDKRAALEKEGGDLASKHPDTIAAKIKEKNALLKDDLARLVDKAADRKNLLMQSQRFYRIKQEADSVEKWAEAQTEEITAAEAPDSLAAVQVARLRHDEQLAELRDREQRLARLRNLSDKMKEENQPRAVETEELLDEVDEVIVKLKKAMDNRAKQIDDGKDLHEFLDHCSITEAWLSGVEGALSAEVSGLSSVSEVETQLRHEDAQEAALEAKEAKTVQGELAQRTDRMMNDKNYGSDQASSRHKQLVHAVDAVRTKCKDRRRLLEAALSLQRFLKSAHEQTSWLRSKMTVAQDPNWIDTTNLQSKAKKHEAFIAEVEANAPVVEQVCDEGRALVADKHFASDEIKDRVNDLVQLSAGLQSACRVKATRLEEAQAAVGWMRKADELDSWMEEKDRLFESDDYGKDLVSVRQQLKKQKLVEDEIETHSPRLEDLRTSAEDMVSKTHFLSDDLSNRLKELSEHFALLPDYAKARRSNLEEAASFYQFVRDVNEEESWIREKMPLAASVEVGDSVAEVSLLQRRHAGLEAEVTAHAHLLEAVGHAASDMIDGGHYARSDVERESATLKESFRGLEIAVEKRREMLTRAAKLQSFLSEVTEAQSWIDDHLPAATTDDMGRDEDSVLALLKKMDALELDVDAFNKTVDTLEKHADDFTDDKEVVKTKTTHLTVRFTEFKEILIVRRTRLLENLKYFEYIRETEELIGWIRSSDTIATQEDYGRDLEDCQIMSENFKDFVQSLQAGATRVSANANQANKLVNEKSRHSPEIKEKCGEMNRLWANLREHCKIRKEALVGAMQVHAFDRDVDDLLDWIEIKRTDVVGPEGSSPTEEDYAHSLETAQELERRHAGFHRDLGAIDRQMDKLRREAQRLESLYPDAEEHVKERLEDTDIQWTSLRDAADDRKKRLAEAVQFQSWLERYRDLMAWMSDMLSRVTADDLATTVSGAERLVQVNGEHRIEIDAHKTPLTALRKSGVKLKSEVVFIASQIQERLDDLQKAWDNLNDACDKRKLIYEQNLDLRQFFSELSDLELWLTEREKRLSSMKDPDSIPTAEDILRRHDELTKSVHGAADRFEAIKRLTLLEQAWLAARKEEDAKKKTQADILNKDRLGEIKRRETQRLAEERRRVEDRRRAHDSLNEEVLQRAAATAEFAAPTPPRFLPRQATADKLAVEQKTAQAGEDAVSGQETPVKARRLKKNASFSTKKPQHSFREKFDLPIAQITGSLDRKQVTQANGRKAPVRQWKTFHAALCGHMLAFFKDEESYLARSAAIHTLGVCQAHVEIARDYTKRQHVLRMRLADGAVFLLAPPTHDDMLQWMIKLQSNAQSSPQDQLRAPEIEMPIMDFNADEDDGETSSVSSPIGSPMGPPDEGHHHKFGLPGFRHSGHIGDKEVKERHKPESPGVTFAEDVAAKERPDSVKLVSMTVQSNASMMSTPVTAPTVKAPVVQAAHYARQPAGAHLTVSASPKLKSSDKRASEVPKTRGSMDRSRTPERASMAVPPSSAGNRQSVTLPTGAKAEEEAGGKKKKEKGLSRLVPSFMRSKHDKKQHSKEDD